MMQIVTCDNCGGDRIALDAVSVNVALSKSMWCEHCRQRDSKSTNYFFCSERCFLEYLKKVTNGLKEFKFDKYDYEKTTPVVLQ